LIRLILKDFRRKANSPWGTMGTLSIPLVIALVLGSAFGTADSIAPTVKLVIQNNDDSWLASTYAGLFTRKEMKGMFDVSLVNEDARILIEDNKASAAVIIPEGFGEAILTGEKTTIQLLKNPAQTISPKIAAKTIEIINTVLSELRMLLDKPLSQILEMRNNEFDSTDMEVSNVSILIAQELRSVGRFVFPPAIELKVTELAADENEDEKFNVYLLFFPGLIVMGVFFIANAYMGDLLEERKQGTLQRTITAGISPLKILVSKVTGCVTYCLLSIVLMRTIGFIFFDVGVGDLLGEFFTLLAASLALTGVMSIVFGLARTEQQGNVFSVAVILVMSLIGGSMMPRQLLAAEMKIAGLFTPNYWCIEAWEALLIKGASLKEVLFPIIILFIIGFVTVTIGSILLKTKFNRIGA